MADRDVIVAGVGFRGACPAADLVGAVRAAERLAGCRVQGIAAPAFKAGPALTEAGMLLGLPLHLVGRDALAAVQHACPTRSLAAERATGLASVAEAAALQFGPLLLPRIVHGQATCAIGGAG